MIRFQQDMKLHFAAIPARDPGTTVDELNAFLSSHRIVGVEKHLVGEGGASYWAGWLESSSASEDAHLTRRSSRPCRPRPVRRTARGSRRASSALYGARERASALPFSGAGDRCLCGGR